MADLTENKPTYSVSQAFQGHGLWQFEEFYAQYKKADSEGDNNQSDNLSAGQNFSFREISRVPQKEVKANFSGDETETVEFELVQYSDGTSFKANMVLTPNPGKNGGKGASFSLDLSNVKDPKQAQALFEKFHALTTDFQLKNHPANTEFRIFTSGDSRWKQLGDDTKRDAILQRADKFRERGIEVYLNDELIVGARKELDAKPNEGLRQSKMTPLHTKPRMLKD